MLHEDLLKHKSVEIQTEESLSLAEYSSVGSQTDEVIKSSFDYQDSYEREKFNNLAEISGLKQERSALNDIVKKLYAKIEDLQKENEQLSRCHEEEEKERRVNESLEKKLEKKDQLIEELQEKLERAHKTIDEIKSSDVLQQNNSCQTEETEKPENAVVHNVNK